MELINNRDLKKIKSNRVLIMKPKISLLPIHDYSSKVYLHKVDYKNKLVTISDVGSLYDTRRKVSMSVFNFYLYQDLIDK